MSGRCGIRSRVVAHLLPPEWRLTQCLFGEHLLQDKVNAKDRNFTLNKLDDRLAWLDSRLFRNARTVMKDISSKWSRHLRKVRLSVSKSFHPHLQGKRRMYAYQMAEKLGVARGSWGDFFSWISVCL